MPRKYGSMRRTLRRVTLPGDHRGGVQDPDEPSPAGRAFASRRARAPDDMSTMDPFDDANEADVAEQAQDLDGGGTVDEPDVSRAEANEADVLEQGANVVGDDDDAYPHAGEEE
jgi:hypothetical protein